MVKMNNWAIIILGVVVVAVCVSAMPGGGDDKGSIKDVGKGGGKVVGIGHTKDHGKGGKDAHGGVNGKGTGSTHGDANKGFGGNNKDKGKDGKKF